MEGGDAKRMPKGTAGEGWDFARIYPGSIRENRAAAPARGFSRTWRETCSFFHAGLKERWAMRRIIIVAFIALLSLPSALPSAASPRYSALFCPECWTYRSGDGSTDL